MIYLVAILFFIWFLMPDLTISKKMTSISNSVYDMISCKKPKSKKIIIEHKEDKKIVLDTDKKGEKEEKEENTLNDLDTSIVLKKEISVPNIPCNSNKMKWWSSVDKKCDCDLEDDGNMEVQVKMRPNPMKNEEFKHSRGKTHMDLY